MAETFRALRVTKTEDGQTVELVELTDDDLMDGDVTVDVEYSTVNYKDGLAITGKAPILRSSPMIPGIDFAGRVVSSEHADYAPGDAVVLTGWGVGESHFGGYAGRARVRGDWLVHLPEGLTAEESMAIGTAGFTAMLCVLALEEQGVRPDDGDVLVTGASGGVGSVAVALLSGLGYRVVASTGKLDERDYLTSLGAAEVIDREEFNTPVRPLGKTRWAGAVDTVGSTTLANVLSQIKPGGSVAACGLAQGMDLPTSVAPFILRGVRLIGVDSVYCPRERRQLAWTRLARDLDKAKLAATVRRVRLEDVPSVAEEIVAGRVRGRVVVAIRG